MVREVMTVEEIRDIMQSWLDVSTVLGGACRGCGAPTPIRLTMADVSGCNWTVVGFPNLIPCCATVVQQVITRARRAYNLAPNEDQRPSPRPLSRKEFFLYSRDDGESR